MDIARVLEPDFGYSTLSQIQEAIGSSNSSYKGLAKLEGDKIWSYLCITGSPKACKISKTC